ncbi:MAG: ABC transporter ATP-binding protein [Candidatus Saccharibacteria bacterium]
MIDNMVNKNSGGLPIIDVVGLNKSFKVGKNDVEVLKGIDIEIMPGEFVLLFGHSGCGKSTFLDTIIGLEKPTGGDISIRGRNLYDMDEDARAKVRQDRFGMVHQQANWIKSLNVVENVAYPLMIAGYKRRDAIKRAEHELELFGLAEYCKYTPTELSGGQQQKVSICRAIVNNPWIIVADEPTGNLDTVSAEEVMNIFKNINEQAKRTIIMVSHNPDYEHYATKLVYMKDGLIEKIVTRKNVSVDESQYPSDLLEMAGGSLI